MDAVMFAVGIGNRIPVAAFSVRTRVTARFLTSPFAKTTSADRVCRTTNALGAQALSLAVTTAGALLRRRLTICRPGSCELHC